MKNSTVHSKLSLFSLVLISLFQHTLAAQTWSLLGNNSTNPELHFIGTTDNQPLQFRVNNQPAGKIDPAKFNTFFGQLTTGTSSTGQHNTAVGYAALSANTTGYGNAAFGKDALKANTTGSDNTGVGSASLQKNTIGVWNTAIGHGALGNNTISSANTAVGDLALYSNISGSNNTAIGEDALRRNTTGTNNTALGENAMNFNATGSNNTAIGRGASITNMHNATAIGYLATANASNKIRLGGTTITSLESQVNLSVTSDGRFKQHFREDVHGLDFIMRLRPVSYNYDVQALNEFYGIPDRIRADAAEKKGDSSRELAELEAAAQQAAEIRHTGFVAQEVEIAALECGYEFTGVVKPQHDRDHYALRYAEFTVPLVKAVQEQQVIIDQQERRITALEALVLSIAANQSVVTDTQIAELLVSPNPSAGIVRVQGNLSAPVDVQVWSQAGQLMLTQSLNAGGNESLDLSKLPSGVYQLQLFFNGKTATKQVVITH